MSFPSASIPNPQARNGLAPDGRSRSGPAPARLYRLVDLQGAPHPVLDDLYDSHDAAWAEATDWWKVEFGSGEDPVGIGVEVSTATGDWRTLRPPCC